jgi:phage terminase large subunit-like protein
VLWGATVAGPHLFEVKEWEKPPGDPDWRVPRTDVEGEVFAAMERWQVVELAADPPGWHRELEDWEAEFGDDVVIRFETKQPTRMGPAVDNFLQAVADGDLTHDRSEVLRRHLSNCVPENRRGYLVPVKADRDSPDKIDAAVGAIIAHQRACWHSVNRSDELKPLAAWA